MNSVFMCFTCPPLSEATLCCKDMKCTQICSSEINSLILRFYVASHIEFVVSQILCLASMSTTECFSVENVGKF